MGDASRTADLADVRAAEAACEPNENVYVAAAPNGGPNEKRAPMTLEQRAAAAAAAVVEVPATPATTMTAPGEKLEKRPSGSPLNGRGPDKRAPMTLEERAAAVAAEEEAKVAEAARVAEARAAEAAANAPAPEEKEEKKPTGILQDPDLAETTVLALLCSKTDAMVQHGEIAKELVHYARKWLKLVADEFKDEVHEGLLKKPRGGIECTITALGPVKDAKNAAQWLTLSMKEKLTEDEPDPSALHMLLISADGSVIFYVSHFNHATADSFRALAFDAEALRERRVIQRPRALPRGKVRFSELASASTALQRVHSLCSIAKLDAGLAIGLGIAVGGGAGAAAALEAPSPWLPLDESAPAVQAQLRRLNNSQRAAIRGLNGPVTLVQGPPGTGKSTFITAVCLTRIPPGARILACTATNKAIDSLVAKLESSGLTQMLCVGSRRSMGEASCRFLMSAVLERDAALAEAEAARAKQHRLDELKCKARKVAWEEVKVGMRLQRDMAAVSGKRAQKKGEELPPLVFDFVILDEAAAMLEPDAIGCLLHGAKAVLLVGDHQQLPPFSKWRDAETQRYTVSLMARLATSQATQDALGKAALMPPLPKTGMPRNGSSSGSLADKGAKAGATPIYVLQEQFRMHPAINSIVSQAFYSNKIKTAHSTAKARQYPMPASFVDLAHGREEFQNGASCFNAVEAHEVLVVVGHCVRYQGFAPERINVLTFYNAQRDLLEKLLKRDGLAAVAVLSVDSMQGREADLVVLSSVRAGGFTGLGFVADTRRVNVALSRAREAMVVVGSAATLRVERMWHSALKGMQIFDGAGEFISAVEANVPPGWGMPRTLAAPEYDRRAERTTAGSGFSEPEGAPEPPPAKLEQREEDVADDWDVSSDEEDGAALT